MENANNIVPFLLTFRNKRFKSPLKLIILILAPVLSGSTSFEATSLTAGAAFYILSGASTAIRFNADFKIIVTAFIIASRASISFSSSTRTLEKV